VTDARRRALERAWRTGRDPADLAALVRHLERVDPTTQAPAALRARLGACGLRLDDLRLAAYLGDADARAALGPAYERWTAFSRGHVALEAWARGLSAFGAQAVRAACWPAAAAWLEALRAAPAPARPAVHASLRVARLVRGLDAAAAAPEDDAARREAGRRTDDLAWMRRDVDPAARAAAALLHRAAQALTAQREESVLQAGVAAIVLADIPPPGCSNRAAARAGLGAGRVRHTVRRALVPRLLG
jgi:hypothetical protein